MPCLHRCLQHASGDTLAATLTSLRWLVRGRLVTKAMFAVELVNEVLSTARQRSCDPRVQVVLLKVSGHEGVRVSKKASIGRLRHNCEDVGMGERL
eukprot:m.101936 g.101936  ORF g.101936 m.101936 type:complete len:96 (+) comp15482_c0_seq1:523-810(+)